MRAEFARAITFVAGCIFAAAASHAATAAVDAGSGAEQRFERMLQGMAGGQLDAALAEAQDLSLLYPNWRLAHLVHGDLLLARSAPLAGFGSAAMAGEYLEDLRAEAVVRLRAARTRPPIGQIPRYLLQLDRGQSHAIVVDARRSRVYVYENAGDTPDLVQEFYSSLGRNGISKMREGDRRTPLGVYHVTARIPGKKLPALYGWGAFPISYPNEWDRLSGRTGRGIWLHGVPSNTYARAPRASDGCVALANEDIARLAKRVQIGVTPVVIADEIEWATPVAVREEREGFMRALEAWRGDWESRDSGRYLAHYARAFRSEGMDIAAWSARKRRVNAQKRWIKVALENMSVLRDPGPVPLMVVTFDQDYRSSNLNERARKRQYWTMEGGHWRIAYEAIVRGATPSLPESFPLRRVARARSR